MKGTNHSKNTPNKVSIQPNKVSISIQQSIQESN